MNRLANKLISYLLLLCISVTVIPFSALHHHEEETHCDITNVALENDPCHISIYHANEIQKPHCEHKSHIDEINIECEFCKYVLSTRHTYIKYKNCCLSPNQNAKTATAYLNTSFKSATSDVIFNKGPPA